VNNEKRSFGERNFGHADLGDARRTKRLVMIADQMALRPGGSLPEKINRPESLKAMYRLFDCEKVTHETILKPHREVVREEVASRKGFTLVIHDATELEYTNRRSIDSFGQIGNGYRRGYIAHNSLAVCPKTGATIGLFNQILHCRPKVSKDETAKQKRDRLSRESRLWVQGTEQLPADGSIVDVCDRGADTFEFIQHEAYSGRTFVIRSSFDRGCFLGHGDRTRSSYLHTFSKLQEPVGFWELEVTSKFEMKSKKRKGKKKRVTRRQRTANMAVSFCAVEIKPPSTQKGEYKNVPVPVWVVRAWEVDPPKGQERLEWFLLTNHPLESFEDCYRVVGWYEKRWVIEEYHKCMKTGMNIEAFQFTDSQRLQPAIVLTSIVAITLLMLRDASRREDIQDQPATQFIDEEYVTVLSAWRHGKPRHDWTVQEFVLALARLSGHQNRRGDHPPGWIKLWKGWVELQAMMTGARIAKNFRTKKCG